MNWPNYDIKETWLLLRNDLISTIKWLDYNRQVTWLRHLSPKDNVLFYANKTVELASDELSFGRDLFVSKRHTFAPLEAKFCPLETILETWSLRI